MGRAGDSLEDRIRAGAGWRPGFGELPLPPRLPALAEFIRDRWPELRVTLEEWTTSTDRKAGRLRIPGRGRRGKRLTVYDRALDRSGYGCRESVLLQHHSGETYRFNSDVCEWIVARLNTHGGGA